MGLANKEVRQSTECFLPLIDIVIDYVHIFLHRKFKFLFFPIENFLHDCRFIKKNHEMY